MLRAMQHEIERVALEHREIEGLLRVIDAEPPAGEVPGSTWIQAAARLAAHWQTTGDGARVWALVRVMEPLLPALEEGDPGSAARVHRVLAAAGLAEGDPSVFLDR